MLKELRKLTSTISIELEASLEKRIKERRQPKLATLLAYLEDPGFFDASNSFDRVLQYASKTAIITVAKDIYMRLYNEEKNSVSPESTAELGASTDDPQPTPPKRKPSDSLRDYKTVPKVDAGSSLSSSNDVKKAMEKAFKYFESTGERPRMLEQVQCLTI